MKNLETLQTETWATLKYRLTDESQFEKPVEDVFKRLISTTYQAGKDAAVEYIEKSFTFSLDELSKSGAEKLKDVLNQARNV